MGTFVAVDYYCWITHNVELIFRRIPLTSKFVYYGKLYNLVGWCAREIWRQSHIWVTSFLSNSASKWATLKSQIVPFDSRKAEDTFHYAHGYFGWIWHYQI